MARQAGSAGEKTAAAIREQSLRLFAQHGYDAVSMRMIAHAVGVQPGALYQYFPTKQQILMTLMREHMEELLASFKAQGIESEPPAAALEHFARFHIRYHLTRADEVFISYMELRALEPAGFQEVESLRKIYETELKAILVRGSEQGIFRIEDSHVSAMAIIAMLTGVNTWYRSGGRLSEKKIEEIYAEMVLRSVGCVD
ncbi:MAG: TetR/AcrR family transcriptional regulator [Rhizobiaceae bacterium]|nr:TetR/AcrR family transcriptional regulator [Rhizobiaceae bacterium]